jgi:hypothetical protein
VATVRADDAKLFTMASQVAKGDGAVIHRQYQRPDRAYGKCGSKVDYRGHQVLALRGRRCLIGMWSRAPARSIAQGDEASHAMIR